MKKSEFCCKFCKNLKECKERETACTSRLGSPECEECSSDEYDMCEGFVRKPLFLKKLQ